MEKRKRMLQIEQPDLSDEAAEIRKQKFLENAIKRKKELEIWLTERGMIPPKKTGGKNE